MSIKHLTPRSIEELEAHERTLFSGKLLKELSFDEIVEIVNLVRPIINEKLSANRKAAKSKFFRGQRITWIGRDGTQHYGEILRLNAKTASIREVIQQDAFHYKNLKWSVSYNLLHTYEN